MTFLILCWGDCNPREGRSAGKFSIDLQRQWCDYKNFDALRNLCSYDRITTHYRYDYWTLVVNVYKLHYVFNMYNKESVVVRYKRYSPEYEDDHICHNLKMRRASKGRPKSKCICIEMNNRKLNKKDVDYFRKMVITRKTVQAKLALTITLYVFFRGIYFLNLKPLFSIEHNILKHLIFSHTLKYPNMSQITLTWAKTRNKMLCRNRTSNMQFPFYIKI